MKNSFGRLAQVLVAGSFLLLAACSSQPELADGGLENEVEQASADPMNETTRFAEDTAELSANTEMTPEQEALADAAVAVAETDASTDELSQALGSEVAEASEAPTEETLVVASNDVTTQTPAAAATVTNPRPKKESTPSTPKSESAETKAETEPVVEQPPVAEVKEAPASIEVAKNDIMKAPEIPVLTNPVAKIDEGEEAEPLNIPPAGANVVQASAGVQGFLEQHPYAIAFIMVTMVGLMFWVARARRSNSIEL